MKKLTMVVAIAALGAATHANAAFSPIVIDPDGALGGSGDITVSTLNWLAGNALTMGALGQTGQSAADVAGTRILTTQYQAQLNTFVNNSGGSSVASLPVSGTQWTVIATFQEAATGIGTATAAFVPLAGSVSIYFNNAVTANDITGLGYNLGTKILQGTVVGGSGTFTDLTRLSPDIFPTKDLDGFGANDAIGITSHVGSGQSTLKVDIGGSVGDFVNANFFKSNISSFNFLLSQIEDVNDTGQLVAPFAQANPSDLVNGVAPSYSPGNINGGDCAVDPLTGNFTQTCDFHFQTTNVTSFNAIPEPGSLAIAGLGLGLLGMFGRRRKVA